MFAKSVALAAQYTRPVIISKRLISKEVSSGIGTFVVVNADGWIVTAAHVVQGLIEMQKSNAERIQYQNAVDVIKANPNFSSGKKKHEIGQLKQDPAWIVNHSLWWGVDGIAIVGNLTVDPAADLAVAQLSSTTALNVSAYPIFGSANNPLPQGTSLCRLGYPFHDIKAVFDETKNAFSIPNLPHLAMFPNDGILTRNIQIEEPTTKRKIRFIETSSAGLLGQSGGPIFDKDGIVWAIQVKTVHLSLGFSPKVKFNGKEVVEHQFMHCGWGTHISQVRAVLDRAQVKYDSIA